MGIAALILGILSLLLSVIPLCGLIALLPALIGLILGIVDVVKKSKSGGKKGIGIAGIILTTIALVFCIIWNVVFVGAIGAAADDLDTYSYYDDYSYDYDYDF